MLFFTVIKKDAVWVRAILDSYESLGVVRAQEPDFDAHRSLMVFMSVPGIVEQARPVFEELAASGAVEFVGADRRLLDQLRSELAG